MQPTAHDRGAPRLMLRVSGAAKISSMRCPVRTLVMLITACSTCATAANAECVRFGPSGLNWPGVEAVFDGTVVELKESGEMQVAQMQVHRVFKGHLPPRIEVYHRPDIEASGIEAGQRYVLPLLRMNPSGTGIVPRRPFLEPKDDPSLVWGTTGCGGVARDTLKQDGTLHGFGRGWPPTR